MAVVGRVARAHGIRGQVIVNLETDFPHERFQPGAELFVNRSGGDGVERFVVTTLRFHRDRPVIGLGGIEDMNAANRLAGAELRVPADRLATLPEGVYYRHDLVGCEVVTESGVPVGFVKAVEGEVGLSRLVVAADGGDVLIPMVAAICLVVDLERRRIVIAPPDGLLELNR